MLAGEGRAVIPTSLGGGGCSADFAMALMPTEEAFKTDPIRQPSYRYEHLRPFSSDIRHPQGKTDLATARAAPSPLTGLGA